MFVLETEVVGVGEEDGVGNIFPMEFLAQAAMTQHRGLAGINNRILFPHSSKG